MSRQQKLTLSVLCSLEEREFPGADTYVHVTVFVLTWPRHVTHISASGRILVVGIVNLCIRIPGGRVAERVIVCLWHDGSAFLVAG